MAKLTQKHLPKTAPSYIKRKKEFANSTLGDVSTPPDEWLSNSENFRNQIRAISIPKNLDMTEMDLFTILILSNLSEESEVLTNTLWMEAAETATDLDNPVTRPGESQDSFQKFYGDKKRCFAASNNLKTFGEEIIVADSAKIRAKLRDRGKKCLWLKYAKKMSLATYRLYVQSQDKKYHIQ